MEAEVIGERVDLGVGAIGARERTPIGDQLGDERMVVRVCTGRNGLAFERDTADEKAREADCERQPNAPIESGVGG